MKQVNRFRALKSLLEDVIIDLDGEFVWEEDCFELGEEKLETLMAMSDFHKFLKKYLISIEDILNDSYFADLEFHVQQKCKKEFLEFTKNKIDEVDI